MFVKSYCKEYYKKHQSWPAVTIRGQISSLRYSIEHSVWREMGPQGWEEGEFENVSLRQTGNFDYFVDQSDLLTDKAICQELSSWPRIYDRGCYQTKHGCNPPPNWSSRHKRVLHEYLFNPYQDTKSIIDEVSIPESELIIEAVPKEKELQREKARFFAKLTYRMRIYQTATESNIATKILSLFDNQSMTMSEDELTHKIASMDSVLADAASPNTYLYPSTIKIGVSLCPLTAQPQHLKSLTIYLGWSTLCHTHNYFLFSVRCLSKTDGTPRRQEQMVFLEKVLDPLIAQQGGWGNEAEGLDYIYPHDSPDCQQKL